MQPLLFLGGSSFRRRDAPAGKLFIVSGGNFRPEKKRERAEERGGDRGGEREEREREREGRERGKRKRKRERERIRESDYNQVATKLTNVNKESFDVFSGKSTSFGKDGVNLIGIRLSLLERDLE